MNDRLPNAKAPPAVGWQRFEVVKAVGLEPTTNGLKGRPPHFSIILCLLGISPLRHAQSGFPIRFWFRHFRRVSAFAPLKRYIFCEFTNASLLVLLPVANHLELPPASEGPAITRTPDPKCNSGRWNKFCDDGQSLFPKVVVALKQPTPDFCGHL